MLVYMEQELFKTKVLPAKDRMFRLARWLMKSEQDAEDMVQESMLRLWQQRSKLPLCHNIEAYAIRTVRNTCLDRHRNKKHKGQQSLDEAQAILANEATPEQHTEARNTEEVIERLMTNLPEQQQWLMRLREVEELSYEEIQEATGLQINAIRTAISRARKNLREKYKEVANYEQLG